MRTWILIGALSAATWAASAPLIGSKAPFTGSTYCQRQGCQLTSAVPLSASLTDETYFLKPQFSGTPAAEAAVLRESGKVVSVGFRMGVQDDPFWDSPDAFSTNQAADLIQFATGKRPTNAWMSKLSCPQQAPRGDSRSTFKGANRAYTVSCLSYPGGNFFWVVLRVF